MLTRLVVAVMLAVSAGGGLGMGMTGCGSRPAGGNPKPGGAGGATVADAGAGGKAGSVGIGSGGAAGDASSGGSGAPGTGGGGGGAPGTGGGGGGGRTGTGGGSPDGGPATDAGPADATANRGMPSDVADAGGDGPWSAPALCALSFVAGPCDGAIPVFAYVGGGCVSRIYGGCQGNDNRFATLEQCLATCEGRPDTVACPAGRTAKRICLSCGLAGGCGESREVCARPCTQSSPGCEAPLTFCSEGFCQAGGCI